MRTLPVTAELFHAEDQRDMTNIIVAFCNLRTRLKTTSITLGPGKFSTSPTHQQNGSV